MRIHAHGCITLTYATSTVPLQINNNHVMTMLTEMQTSLSLTHEARVIYTPAAYRCFSYIQAEHRYAAALINLLFKGNLLI